MLTVKNIRKSFGNTETLSDISLHVNDGEFVSIIGPSGCGKSTLLNIVSGITKETSGTVEKKKECAYMFQKPLLLPWKTTLENVMLGLVVKGVGKQAAREQARALLAEFGLLDFAQKYPRELSGGMAQRVAILRTILFNKDFILFDEPFASVDAITRSSLQKWLVDICKKFKSSVLFVTHDIREAVLLSDRIYIMSARPGKIIKEILVNRSEPSHTIEEIERLLGVL